MLVLPEFDFADESRNMRDANLQYIVDLMLLGHIALERLTNGKRNDEHSLELSDIVE